MNALTSTSTRPAIARHGVPWHRALDAPCSLCGGTARLQTTRGHELRCPQCAPAPIGAACVRPLRHGELILKLINNAIGCNQVQVRRLALELARSVELDGHAEEARRIRSWFYDTDC